MTVSIKPAKAGVNHKQNAVRFAIIVFWSAMVGIALSAVMHSDNLPALGWPTLLVYAALGIPALYAGFFLTKQMWSIK